VDWTIRARSPRRARAAVAASPEASPHVMSLKRPASLLVNPAV